MRNTESTSMVAAWLRAAAIAISMVFMAMVLTLVFLCLVLGMPAKLFAASGLPNGCDYMEEQSNEKRKIYRSDEADPFAVYVCKKFEPKQRKLRSSEVVLASNSLISETSERKKSTCGDRCAS